MIDVDYPAMLDLFRGHLAPGRSESAAFLIWYLEHYYRLDTEEAVDAVCDQRGDKGVDGIFVNDGNQTITIFQAKISQRVGRTVGDSALREFAGTILQFKTAEGIQNLIASANEARVAALVKRLDLIPKLATHEVCGEFLSNVDIDQNGIDYLKTASHIIFVGKEDLLSTYVSDSRDTPIQPEITFDISGLEAAEYIVDADTKAIIVPIKANELVTMTGIADQSLFAYNVRGPLGRTQVNKDIKASISQATRHKLFPLFHNGITIIAKQLERTKEKIKAGDYFVVNGCQSVTALYGSRAQITDDLRVLVKFIKADPGSSLAEQVTRFSNNQNGVRPRDFKSNDKIQIRLQNEMKESYGSDYVYEIKRGESGGSPVKMISNEDAGLYFMAFDLKEPWATHRRYQVFEDKHSELFGRPDVTAHRVVLLQIIMEAIDASIPKIKNQLIGRYTLCRYLIMYIVREILEADEMLSEVSAKPQKFVLASANREHFRKCVDVIVNDIVGDLNAELGTYEDNFDYRAKLRDTEWVKKIARTVVADHRRLVTRGLMPSFKTEWQKQRS